VEGAKPPALSLAECQSIEGLREQNDSEAADVTAEHML
jgi:hypothetical protein